MPLTLSEEVTVALNKNRFMMSSFAASQHLKIRGANSLPGPFDLTGRPLLPPCSAVLENCDGILLAFFSLL